MEDSLTVQPQTAAPQDHPDLLHALPLWQRRYLAAIEAGLSESQASSSANVTPGTIAMYSLERCPTYSAAFARASQLAHEGVAVVGRDQVRADAQAEAAVVRRDAFMESRGLDPETGARAMEPIVSYKDGAAKVIGERAAIRPQDRVANRRLVLEAAGAIGPGAQTMPDGRAIADAFFDKLLALRDADRLAAADQAPQPQRQLPAPAQDTERPGGRA